jgi:hypothetical protein
MLLERWCDIIRDIVIDVEAFEALAKNASQKIVFQQLMRFILGG